MSLQDSRQLENIKVLLKVGADGRGIADVELVGTSGDVNTYDIVLTDGTRYPFDVTNGSSIASIEKTATVGLTDTYTITLTNGDEYYFEVTNADGSTAGTIDYDNTESGLTADKVQGAIDEVNDKVDTKANKTDLTSISETGATASQAISSGTYFYLNGVLVRAKTAIASGASFTLNTNYEVVPNGGLNELNNRKMSKDGSDVIRANVGSGATILNYVKSGGSGLYILYTQNAEDSPTKGIVSYTWVHYVSSSYIYLRCFLGDSIYYALCGSNTSSISWTKIV